MIKTLFLKVKHTLKLVMEAIVEGKAQRAKFYMSSHSTKIQFDNSAANVITAE